MILPITCDKYLLLFSTKKVNKFQNSPKNVVSIVIQGELGMLIANIILPTTCGKYMLLLLKTIKKTNLNIIPET